MKAASVEVIQFSAKEASTVLDFAVTVVAMGLTMSVVTDIVKMSLVAGPFFYRVQ